MDNIITKVCIRCDQEKGIDDFYKGNICRECAIQRSGEWRKNNPERRKQIANRWAQNNKDCLNKWRSSNQEKVKKSKRDYYARNTEKVRKAIKEWFSKNPGKTREYKNNRRARLANSGGTVTAKEWRSVLEKYRKCLCCGRTDVSLEMDHVIPLSKGGLNTVDNVQPLCEICNNRKGTKAVDYR